MATKPKAAAAVKARVLAHIHAHGVNNGDLITGTEAEIAALAQAGLVDPHPDAVAHAEANEARVVAIKPPAAEPELESAPAEPAAE